MLTRAVTDFDDDLRTLARDMFATMHAAQGVGLAATQVGVDLSMFVFECPDDDDVADAAVADPPFGAVEHPVVAVAACGGLQRDRV